VIVQYSCITTILYVRVEGIEGMVFNTTFNDIYIVAVSCIGPTYQDVVSDRSKLEEPVKTKS
jgi:hypothetical protein